MLEFCCASAMVVLIALFASLEIWEDFELMKVACLMEDELTVREMLYLLYLPSRSRS